VQLPQAKNGDKCFWKEKFYAANGKAQNALMNGPVFFFLQGWGGGERFFCFFPPCQKGNTTNDKKNLEG
jgi:hypothetical protein